MKRTFNALLNADKIDTINEIEGYAADLTGRDWQEFKRFIVSQYPEFQSHFGSGVGLRLQRKRRTESSSASSSIMASHKTLLQQ